MILQSTLAPPNSLSSTVSYSLSFPSGSRSLLPVRTVRPFSNHSIKCCSSISNVYSYGTVDFERKPPLKWNHIYKRISMIGDPEIGVASVLNQCEKEGKRLTKWELSRIARELRKFRRHKLAIEIYQHQHNKQMSCPGMAQLLSNTLYYKRFFPYYAFNVLGGLDSEGKGCVFTYDAVGSYEKVGYSSQGSGAKLIMPFLDNQLKSPSPLLLPALDAVTPLSELEAIDLVRTAFASATERDIYTGDKLEVVVLNKDGIRREYMELRRD